MKKVISIFMAVIIISIFPLCVGAYQVGDVVGYALSTDIAATINGYDIPSYNVDGYTYIVAEDLQYYGFSVIYDNASRSLSITRDPSQMYVSKVYEKPYILPGKAGVAEHKILYTDIATYLDGYYTHSYNINGQTIIRFDALSAYGYVSYDNNKREISLTLSGIGTNPHPIQDRAKSHIWSKDDFLDRANGWWVDLNSCRFLPWDDGCILDYIRFSPSRVEFGSTYSEFWIYELKELTHIGNNTYNALFYMPGYWYGDEYIGPEYSNSTIIYNGGDEFKISYNGEDWYTYTFIGTGYDYNSIQNNPLVVDAANN